jgi:polyisoprenoid-binding protein YceI
VKHIQNVEQRGAAAARADLWHAGPRESEIRFSLKHLGLAEVSGHVGRWSAAITLDVDQPSRSSIDVVVDASSLETGATVRDNHMRSSGFLNIVTYPEIRFRSRQIRSVDDDRRFTVVGDLTIRDVTREVTVAVERQDPSRTIPARAASERKLVFTARASINRQDFGLRWHQELDWGGLIAGDKVDLESRVVARPGGAR